MWLLLVIIISTSGGLTSTVLYFTDRAACEAAIGEISKSIPAMTHGSLTCLATNSSSIKPERNP